MDAKAKVKIGPFSRGEKSRRGEKGADHDFEPKGVLTPWGIFLPAFDKSFLYFSKSNRFFFALLLPLLLAISTPIHYKYGTNLFPTIALAHFLQGINP